MRCIRHRSVMSLGAVGEVRSGFDMLLSSKRLGGLDIRPSEQDFYHPGGVFWEALGDIAPHLKWLRLCIPDPIFGVSELIFRHPLDAKRTALYPVAASKFISRCTGLRSLVVFDSGAERIVIILSKLPRSAQLHELQIKMRGLWLGVLEDIGLELPRWIQEYPCCRKLRVLDVPPFAVETAPSLATVLRARRVQLRQSIIIHPPSSY